MRNSVHINEKRNTCFLRRLVQSAMGRGMLGAVGECFAEQAGGAEH